MKKIAQPVNILIAQPSIRFISQSLNLLTSQKTNRIVAWGITPPPTYPMYGYLYNWYAVDDERNIAPEGFRVASHNDVSNLINYLINEYSFVTSSNIGTVLKSGRQDNISDNPNQTNVDPYWQSTSTHYGTNDFNYSAIPGGRRNVNGTFFFIRQIIQSWLTDEFSSSNSMYFGTSFNSQLITITNQEKKHGFSVRCLRNLVGNESSLNDGDYCGLIKDLDENTYHVVKIGNQAWIVENLATTKYQNGDSITNITVNSTWTNTTSGAYCAYNNDESLALTRDYWL